MFKFQFPPDSQMPTGYKCKTEELTGFRLFAHQYKKKHHGAKVPLGLLLAKKVGVWAEIINGGSNYQARQDYLDISDYIAGNYRHPTITKPYCRECRQYPPYTPIYTPSTLACDQ
jgi:hypothetical protein